MDNKTFSKNRVLFKVDNCDHCILLRFIEKINMKVAIDKRVKVVDCTIYQNYGIITDHLILLYNKYISGYPVAFIGNRKIDGANSQIESEALYNAILDDDFIVNEYNKRKFNKVCAYVKKGLFRSTQIKCE